MNDEMKLTPGGLVRLKKELQALEAKRKEIIERLKDAKDYGDISENSEFEETKNEQGFIERKINELETIIKIAKIIDRGLCNREKVEIGCQIKLKSDNEELIYALVSYVESDPVSGKISIDSPVGQALLGRVVGEKVQVTMPSGKMVEYEIIEIG